MTALDQPERIGSPAAIPTLDRRFEAIILDWDGVTGGVDGIVIDELRNLIERLCAYGMDLAVVSRRSLADVDGRLGARPDGPGSLFICVARGARVFRVLSDGPAPVYVRAVTAHERAALARAAERTAGTLSEQNVPARVGRGRAGRVRIDLLPPNRPVTAVPRRLRTAGGGRIEDVVLAAEHHAREAGLTEPRVTTNGAHVEIGLTDRVDSALWIFRHLWERGIAPGAVLVAAGDTGSLRELLPEPESLAAAGALLAADPLMPAQGVVPLAGTEGLLVLLADQLARRSRHDPPGAGGARGWMLAVSGDDPERERVRSALVTLGDGVIGTRFGPATGTSGGGVLAAGIYAGHGSATALAPLPSWTWLASRPWPGSSPSYLLDLRTGVLRSDTELPEGDLAVVAFSSLARPGTVALRASGGAALVDSAPLVAAPTGCESGRLGSRTWMRQDVGAGGVTAAAVQTVSGVRRAETSLERLGAYRVSRSGPAHRVDALLALAEAEEAGFERLLGEQRAAWAQRWKCADIVIEGDDELQLAVRFALFHLMGSVGVSGEAAVGARGLSGPGYNGHVFWDADVFVLPFLAATHPAAARAMLEYRVLRLPAAREAARELGRAGARFPWESAESGFDVTPTSMRNWSGTVVPVLTGQMEEHVIADVAWATSCYLDWSGDEAFATGGASALLVETAQYWASRIRRDGDGRGHIEGVIGPDEYHEDVDDNAFTNVMARWNLRRAAEVPGVDPAERRRWLELAETIADGFEPSTGVYEQFAGFFDLEDLIIADVAPSRPIAADLLLGSERVVRSQVVKQADVLMLHHLIPDGVEPGSRAANLDYYERRTAHGSSLSPAIHAALLARERSFDRALEALRMTSRIDLDDITATTAGGLHLATMGGLWQTLAWGFAGVRVRGGVLEVDPRLPPNWTALELNLCFRGTHVRVRIEPDSASVRATSPVTVRGAAGGSVSGRTILLRAVDDWEAHVR